jgi:hypothetical protein
MHYAWNDINIPAPLCPKPPDVPLEGVREFVPNVYALEPVETCGLVGETSALVCHSFLSVYVEMASFGRMAVKERELCDGAREKDRSAPGTDCLETTAILRRARQLCHGRARCSLTVEYGLANFTNCMPTDLKRELRTSHICGNGHSPAKLPSPFSPVACSNWALYADTEAPGCLDTALLENHWATTEELVVMEEEMKKSLLAEKLNQNLDDSVHSIVDLSLRAVSAPQGGLCGLAAIYQALEGTVLTKSQLRTLGYEELVEVMAEEILMETKEALKKSDAEVLMHFYDCELPSHFFIILFPTARDLH